jgi:SOS-response transcriptional repressor LexA
MDEELYTFETQQVADDQSGLAVHSGFPNPSQDATCLSLDFNQLLVQHPSGTFVFRIRGHDWSKYGIWDKDLAIIDRLLDPRSSDMVVWTEDGSSSFGLSQCKMMPDEATLWGVVTAIVHEFRKVIHD